MPVTTCAAIRLGSVVTPPLAKSSNPYAPTIVKRAEPSETSMCVRSPAAFSSSSRSRPIAAPRPAAAARRNSTSSQSSEGISATRRIHRQLLCLSDPRDPLVSELEQLLQLVAPERLALRRRLYLDQPVIAGDHHVEVDVRARVLDVVQVEEQLSADDPERDRGNRARHRLREAEPVERPPRGDPGPGD